MKPPFRRRLPPENSLDGEILLEGARLRVLFRFDPARVAYIKSIKGARYEPESKTWSIPRERYAELTQSRLFPAETYPRSFAEEALQHSLEQLSLERDEALAAYQRDRFAVPAHLIPLLGVDVAVFCAQDIPQLRAKVRFGSKAAPIVARTVGAHFIRSEGRFALSAANLAPLLLKLRDKGLRFAVERECGLRLKQSAELRKQLLSSPELATPQDLEEALLTPYVDFAQSEDAVGYELKYASSRHLAELFPDEENFHARKRKSLCLNDHELFTLVNRIEALEYPLYLTRAVRSQITRQAARYETAIGQGELAISEELVPFLKLPKAWVALESGAGLLLDAEALTDSLLQSLKPYPFEKLGKKRFYRPIPSRLVEFYEQAQELVAAPEGQGFSNILEELKQRRALLQRNQKAKLSHDIPLAADLFSEPTLSTALFPHQRVAVDWLAQREYALLGDDMGLGKTLSVLATLDLLLTKGSLDFCLIVCPNSLARNWQREARRFIPKRSCLLLPEAPKERGVLLKSLLRGQLKAQALIVNYERLRRPDVFSAVRELLESRRSLLCCDESQRVKNARSQTFLALQQLAPLCRRKIALTGTPTPRDITDIWSQVLLLDGGQRFGTNYLKWLRSVAELGTKYSDFGVRKMKNGAVEETLSRVHELLLRRKKEEVISLPEKLFATRDCRMSGSQATRYDEVREQLLLRVSTLSGGSLVKQIDSLLEEYLRAVQIASNPRLVDEHWKGEPCKFLELDEIVNEVVIERSEKIVIWTNFLGNVAELTQRYAGYGARPFSGEVSSAQRDQTVQDFQNNPEVKVLVAVPAAGGVGITLTAAQTAIYLDKSWNAEHWLQSVDRIHRIGQKGTVSIISLSACKIDELIMHNLRRKERAQALLLGDVQTAEESQRALTDYPSRDELLEALQETDRRTTPEGEQTGLSAT